MKPLTCCFCLVPLELFVVLYACQEDMKVLQLLGWESRNQGLKSSVSFDDAAIVADFKVEIQSVVILW